MGARELGPWVVDQKPLGKTPLGANRGPEMTYLPTYRPPFTGPLFQSLANKAFLKTPDQ